MFDLLMVESNGAHRRRALLEEAARERLLAEARRAARAVARRRAGSALPVVPVRHHTLHRLGAWLIQTGERLQAAAEPPLVAA